MRVKKFLIVALMAVLSVSLMACPEVVNLPPEIVVIEDGEVVQVNEIVYEHVEGTQFDPEVMLQHLINEQGLAGIDYDQSGIAVGSERNYVNISDQIVIETFYDIWEDGEDANFDGVVDAEDEEFLGQYQTDEAGNYVYDQGKILLISMIFRAGEEVEFTLKLTDQAGDEIILPGRIVIIEAN